MNTTPPRVGVLNPNRSAWMTQAVCDALAAALGPGTELRGLTAQQGPEVIDNAERFEQAGHHIQAAARNWVQREGPPQALLLACFGDPGLEALHADPLLPPVVGLAQAAMQAAAAGGERFAVLTCGRDWEALLRQRARDFGLGEQLAGVWSLPVNGAAFAQDPKAWWPDLLDLAAQAAAAGATRLILGGAVFAGLHPPALPGGTPALQWVDAIAAAAAALRKAVAHPDRPR
jgi:allantoin racemase